MTTTGSEHGVTTIPARDLKDDTWAIINDQQRYIVGTRSIYDEEDGQVSHIGVYVDDQEQPFLIPAEKPVKIITSPAWY